MIDPTTRKLEAGDVVQIDAVGPKRLFAGCFMTVTDPRPWGAMGYISVPRDRENSPGLAYYRAQWEEMTYIGRAEWVAE